MRTRNEIWTRVGAVAGLAGLLLAGAVAVAPGAGATDGPAPSEVLAGNAKCADVGLEGAFEVDPSDEDAEGGISGEGFTVQSYLADGVRHFDWTSTTPLGAVIVKQGTSSAVFTYDPAATSGTVYVVLRDGENGNVENKAMGYSHVSFCVGEEPEEPETGRLEVVKKVEGVEPGETGLFGFSGDLDSFELPDAGAVAFDPILVDTYTITESDPGGADSTTVECVDAEDQVVASGAESVDVTVVAGTTITCTFTNTFVPTEVTPEPASLTVVKEVTGDAPDAWSFEFSVEGPGTDEDFTLDQSESSTSFGDLDAGAYVITESPAEAASFAGADCVDAEGGPVEVVLSAVLDGDTTVSLDLAEGDDVTCTITNDFPEVEDEEVVKVVDETPTTTPPAVLDSTITTLPRTGTGTGPLTVVGLGAVLAGVAMAVASRRRIAEKR